MLSSNGSVLPWLTFGLAVLGVVLAGATFWRAGFWRSREEAEGRARQTEIKVNQVDQAARDKLAEIEEKLGETEAAVYAAMRVGDGDVRQALSRVEGELRQAHREQAVEIGKIQEHMAHLPTQSDLGRLREDVGELKASSAGMTARLGGVSELLTRMDRTLVRLEDHVLKVQS